MPWRFCVGQSRGIDLFSILSLFRSILAAAMTNSRLTFGEMTILGELAIWSPGCDPADELSLRMALALGKPPDGHDAIPPPFATVPVILDGFEIGWLVRIEYACGDRVIGGVAFPGRSYEFRSASGKTRITDLTKERVLERLEQVLQLTS